jgi:surfactin synthase thioesterase subunit
MAVIPGTEDWIRRFHQSLPGSVRLVCFPHAAGSAAYFFGLSQRLSPRVEVLAVQYPGRTDRRLDGFIENIPDLSSRAFDAVGPWAQQPFALFGHSMGAVVAFEVARRFQDQTDRLPARLFVSGWPAPSVPPRERVDISDDASLVAELRLLGGTDPQILEDADMRGLILPVARADYRAIGSYSWVPGAPLGCPITAMVGNADPRVSVEDTLRWREHSVAGFDLNVFGGGHFYLDKHQPALADLIAESLRDVAPGNARPDGLSFGEGGLP